MENDKIVCVSLSLAVVSQLFCSLSLCEQFLLSSLTCSQIWLILLVYVRSIVREYMTRLSVSFPSPSIFLFFTLSVSSLSLSLVAPLCAYFLPCPTDHRQFFLSFFPSSAAATRFTLHVLFFQCCLGISMESCYVD